MGLSDDSIAYIAGARSILAGQGYREAWLASNQPVTHFPPGFSSVLALAGLGGLDPLRGTRLINSLIFGANIFMLGLIGWRMTRSKIAGFVLALLLLTNGQLFRVHTTAMSEPLYIFFTLAAFLVFSQYFLQSERSSVKYLLLTAVLTAFAYLTRYAGLALFATFAVSILILHNTWRKRILGAMIYSTGFVPFALAWGIRNRLLTDNATNRTLVYHPILPENVQLGISNFAAFLLPVDGWRHDLMKVPNLFAAILSILIFSLLVWATKKGLKKFLRPGMATPEILSFVSALYIFGYLASILSSMTLFDASTKFQLRIVAPIYVCLLILLVYFGWWLWQRQRAATILLSLLILALSFYGFSDTMTQLRKGGQGYASFQWFDSEAMAFLGRLPEGTRIYSNQVGPVYLYTGRPGYVLPDLVDPVTGRPRSGFEEGVAALQADIGSGAAALALFDFNSQDEEVQSVYQHIAGKLPLAFDKQGDKIYTAFP